MVSNVYKGNYDAYFTRDELLPKVMVSFSAG